MFDQMSLFGNCVLRSTKYQFSFRTLLPIIGTIMCYGQTGAGKTFTMTGATENYKHRGLIPRALSQLFRDIDERPDYAINLRYLSARFHSHICVAPFQKRSVCSVR